MSPGGCCCFRHQPSIVSTVSVSSALLFHVGRQICSEWIMPNYRFGCMHACSGNAADNDCHAIPLAYCTVRTVVVVPRSRTGSAMRPSRHFVLVLLRLFDMHERPSIHDDTACTFGWQYESYTPMYYYIYTTTILPIEREREREKKTYCTRELRTYVPGAM